MAEQIIKTSPKFLNIGTEKVPHFINTNCIETCKLQNGGLYINMRPSRGNRDFHVVYPSSENDTYQKVLKFLQES